ncbi:MAG: hypothetical protein JSV63_00715 [Candidatus Aenigmatarchaeota archaeon]|nr:MAG: hypothetical protein JSV63_00715 [Candidatus Aenigmarchaeota archaeon]
MKPGLLLISLTVTLMFNQGCVAGAEYPQEILYPFWETGETKLLVNPYLDQSFIDYLVSNDVYPVIDRDGSTLFYFSENEEFGCVGICDRIVLGEYVMASNSMETEAFPALPQLENQVVVGDDNLKRHIESVNTLREILSHDDVALDEFEKILLENNQDPLKRLYYENAYDDVFDYAIEEMRNIDPGAYNSIANSIDEGDLDGAVNSFENFMNESYNIDSAFDASDLYSALENGNIGTKQFEELLENVIDRMAENEGFDIDPQDLDRLSELLNSEEFGDITDKISENIENNPEIFDKIKDLSGNILDSPQSRELFEEAIREMMENVKWEHIQRLIDLFNKIDNKEELMQTLMEGFSKHMRELLRTGKADEIKSFMDDEKLMQLTNQAMQSFSTGFLDQLRELISNIPIEFAYVLALVVTITTLIMLAKIKM